jgi:hypothetical protein
VYQGSACSTSEKICVTLGTTTAINSPVIAMPISP